MKVQSWPTLLVTVFCGGGLLLYSIQEMRGGNGVALLMILFDLYVIVRGLNVSFSKEAYEEDQRQAAKGKQIYRERFGKWAPIVPYIPAILILLAAACAWIFPATALLRGVLLVLLLAAVVSSVWLAVWYRKQMGKAEQDQTL